MLQLVRIRHFSRNICVRADHVKTIPRTLQASIQAMKQRCSNSGDLWKCIKRAQSTLENCLLTHKSCVSSGDMPLPRRVIDRTSPSHRLRWQDDKYTLLYAIEPSEARTGTPQQNLGSSGVLPCTSCLAVWARLAVGLCTDILVLFRL